MVLLIDGDFLCYYQAHAIQSKGNKLENLTKPEFVQQVLRTLNYFATKLLGNRVSNFIFTFDEGTSWRYEFLERHDIKYKDRNEDDKRKLNNFPAYRQFFRDTLSYNDFVLLAVSGQEADDMIHVASGVLKDSEVCIVSGDSDLQQKLSSTKDKEVYILNPHIKDGFPLLRTIYQPSNDVPVDDFFAADIPTKFIETATNSKLVDPTQVLFVKIISGDSTDTIPSAFKYSNGVTSKTVGKARAENFHRSMDKVPDINFIKNLYLDRTARVELAQQIVSFAKLKVLNKINDFERGLLRNVQCILLDDIIYPPDMLNRLEQVVLDQVKSSEPIIDLVTIFRGTEFDFLTNYYKY